jgi:hypothetical protein
MHRYNLDYMVCPVCEDEYDCTEYDECPVCYAHRVGVKLRKFKLEHPARRMVSKNIPREEVKNDTV